MNRNLIDRQARVAITVALWPVSKWQINLYSIVAALIFISHFSLNPVTYLHTQFVNNVTIRELCTHNIIRSYSFITRHAFSIKFKTVWTHCVLTFRKRNLMLNKKTLLERICLQTCSDFGVFYSEQRTTDTVCIQNMP